MLRVIAERRQIIQNSPMISQSAGEYLTAVVFTGAPHSYNESISSARLHPIKRLSGEICNNTIQPFNV